MSFGNCLSLPPDTGLSLLGERHPNGYARRVFSPIRTTRASEVAAEQIVEAILDGDLKPGDRLPSERSLAWQMEVSRPTLREGIKLLADAGVIEVRPGAAGGMFIATEYVPEALRQPQTELRISEVSGVLEARRMFEPRVAQLAALYAREDDYEALRQTIEQMRERTHNHDLFHQLDQRFHLEMAKATGNQSIVGMMRYLLRQLGAVRRVAMAGPHDPEWAVEMHEKTLQAIMAGAADEIEMVMDEHLGYLERFWEDESGRARLRTIPDFLLPHSSRSGPAEVVAAPVAAKRRKTA